MKMNKQKSRSANYGSAKDLKLCQGQIYPNNNHTKNKKQVVCRFDGKPVGYIEDGVLKKQVQASKHMLRIPRGWAWDKDILEEVLAEGIEITEVFDTEEEITYTAKIEDILEKGQAVNRGYGLQIVLHLYLWKKKKQKKTTIQSVMRKN
jgi:hypothetical protein